MAKNCPNCNTQISDEATYCPVCGYNSKTNTSITSRTVQAATYSEDDTKLCCPICGSTELHSSKKGFSGGKALAGVILTGGVGLLAGTIGSSDVVVTCLACGHKTKAGNLITKKQFSEKKALNGNTNIQNTGCVILIVLFTSMISFLLLIITVL